MMIVPEKNQQTFVIKFLLSFSLFLIAGILLPESLFQPLRIYTTSITGFLLELTGIDIAVKGINIISPAFSVHVITECTSLFPWGLLLCFILSYPAKQYQKSFGLLGGIIFLDLINTFRIVVSFLVGYFKPDMFQYVHVFLGEILMSVVTVFYVCVWISCLQPQHQNDRPIFFILRTVIISCLLFFPWIWFQRYYIRGIDFVLMQIFNMIARPISFTYQHTIYVQTFNMVTFAALIFASWRVSFKNRLIWLACGGLVLVSAHLLFRLGNVLLTAYSFKPAFAISTMIHLTGQFLLPIGIWYIMLISPMRNNRESCAV